MKRNTRLALAGLMAAALGGMAGGAAAQSNANCDRACLKGLADKVLDSMPARAPHKLPLAPEYAATENSIPTVPHMMVAWQTVTGIKDRFYIIDPVSQQLFMIASVAEGPSTTLLYGRIKAQGGRVAELELFETRSRGQSGFQYSGNAVKNMPKEWTAKVGRERLPSRDALLQQGRAVFDTGLTGLAGAPDCVLMESGKVVAENPDVAKAVAEMTTKRNADGSVPIPCGVPPLRPTDPQARVDIVDEEQGIVVAQAVVQGVTEAYLAITPAESAYVPDEILEPYHAMMAGLRNSGKNTSPLLKTMRASAAAIEIHRIYDNKLQGQILLTNLGAPGAHSPWVAK